MPRVVFPTDVPRPPAVGPEAPGVCFGVPRHPDITTNPGMAHLADSHRRASYPCHGSSLGDSYPRYVGSAAAVGGMTPGYAKVYDSTKEQGK